jgi:hypothetical protein
VGLIWVRIVAPFSDRAVAPIREVVVHSWSPQSALGGVPMMRRGTTRRLQRTVRGRQATHGDAPGHSETKKAASSPVKHALCRAAHAPMLALIQSSPLPPPSHPQHVQMMRRGTTRRLQRTVRGRQATHGDAPGHSETKQVASSPVRHALYRAAHAPMLALIQSSPLPPPSNPQHVQMMRRGTTRRLQRTVRGRQATHGDAPGHSETKQVAPSPVRHALYRAAHAPMLALIQSSPLPPPSHPQHVQMMRRGTTRRLQRTVRGRQATHGDAPGHSETKQVAPSPVRHALYRAAHAPMLALIQLSPLPPPSHPQHVQMMRRGTTRRLQRTVRGRQATHGDAPGHSETKKVAPSPVRHALYRAAHAPMLAQRLPPRQLSLCPPPSHPQHVQMMRRGTTRRLQRTVRGRQATHGDAPGHSETKQVASPPVRHALCRAAHALFEPTEPRAPM